jgi:hypothetical protein
MSRIIVISGKDKGTERKDSRGRGANGSSFSLDPLNS